MAIGVDLVPNRESDFVFDQKGCLVRLQTSAVSNV